MSQGYPSPFTGQQVDSAVSAYISGDITSAINTASGAAVAEANTYTDVRTSMTRVSDGSATSITVPVLSGGVLYTYSQPVTTVSVGSVVSNSIGDIIHFSAAAAEITIDLPAGLTVLLYDPISSGSAYDLMVCDDRLLLKSVVSTTTV